MVTSLYNGNLNTHFVINDPFANITEWTNFSHKLWKFSDIKYLIAGVKIKQIESSVDNMLEDLTKSEHAGLRSALNRFDTPGDKKKSLANIDSFINLSIFLGDRNGTIVNTDTKTIIEIFQNQDYDFLSQPQFLKWSNDVPELKNEVMWQFN